LLKSLRSFPFDRFPYLLTVNREASRRLDAETNPVAADTDDHNANVADADRLIPLS
jgi:hypothetical protein